jgi:hypothetical protein
MSKAADEYEKEVEGVSPVLDHFAIMDFGHIVIDIPDGLLVLDDLVVIVASPSCGVHVDCKRSAST